MPLRKQFQKQQPNGVSGSIANFQPSGAGIVGSTGSFGKGATTNFGAGASQNIAGVGGGGSLTDFLNNQYGNPNAVAAVSQDPLAKFGLQQAGGNPDSQGGFSNFLSSFKNDDGSFNLGNIGTGIQGIGNLMGAFMALKQFGLAEDAFDHNVALDQANLGNQAKLAQSRLDLQAQRRAQERPDLYGNQEVPQLQQTIGETP